MRYKPLTIILIALLAVSVGPSTQTVFPQDPPLSPIVYVDADTAGGSPGTGTVDDPYDTITKGIINVESGGKVIVAPGTYVEALTINKSLTLRGSGLDRTTIDGGGQGNVITLTGSAVVTVEHFRITGGGATNAEAGLRKAQTGTHTATFTARWNDSSQLLGNSPRVIGRLSVCP